MTESRAASSLITSSDDLDSNLDIVVDMEGARGGRIVVMDCIIVIYCHGRHTD